MASVHMTSDAALASATNLASVSRSERNSAAVNAEVTPGAGWDERRIVGDRAGLAGSVARAAVYSLIGWLRWVNYWSSSADLLSFDQAVWLLSRGDAPEVTILGQSVFAD